MLENVKYRKTRFWLGVDVSVQTEVAGRMLRLRLPLYMSDSHVSGRGEKESGSVAFVHNESSLFPPSMPNRLLSGPLIARIERSGLNSVACLEMGAGKRGEPLQLILAGGILGDGQTQAVVNGREAWLTTVVESGALINVDSRNSVGWLNLSVIEG